MAVRINDPYLQQLIEDCCAAVTAPDGRFAQGDAIEELSRRLHSTDLTPGQRALLEQHQSHALVSSFADQRNPRRLASGSWYHPQFMLKLGQGERIWMALALRNDVSDWLNLSAKNAAGVLASEGLKQAWGNKRIAAYDSLPGIRYLDELERVHFGYVDTDEDPTTLF
ncbi:hypothetical protein [Streptacidiphilus fuscans]|uniref:Uncharacterized protein n=1 Tax=Streptacidiphilus fuscans TaxID=2789292 RepID=A0A931B7S1_9ACTN|nr:hypothetical protein [Streptacidiphilus fuscans]MBF9071773.1 hypothetical protein [Streptacidiphilus fuscans]